MEDERLIRGSVIHVMNYIVIELLRYGYKLAMKDELADMRDLIDTNADKWMRPGANEETAIICLDDDLELLSTLKDPVIKRLMISIERIIDMVDTYAVITSPDIDELLMEDELHETAGGIFYTYFLDMDEDGTYGNLLDNLIIYYSAICLLMWYCITQIELDQLDVFEEALEFSNKYYLSEELEFKKQGSDLLLALCEDLSTDSEQLWKLKQKLK